MAERRIIDVVVPAGGLGIKLKKNKNDAGGWIVKDVKSGSRCKNLLKVNDIITHVDGISINDIQTTEQLNSKILIPKRNEEKTFTISRWIAGQDDQEHVEDEGYQMRPRQATHTKQLESTTQSQRDGRTRKRAQSEELVRDTQPTKKKKVNQTTVPIIFVNHNPLHVSKLLCDICNQPDGHFRKNMQICSECGVAVHEECYGLSNSSEGRKYPAWKCHACSSKFLFVGAIHFQ